MGGRGWFGRERRRWFHGLGRFLRIVHGGLPRQASPSLPGAVAVRRVLTSCITNSTTFHPIRQWSVAGGTTRERRLCTASVARTVEDRRLTSNVEARVVPLSSRCTLGESPRRMARGAARARRRGVDPPLPC